MKKIAFLLVSHGHGVDGRGEETITAAFWNEQERDAAKGKNTRLSTKDIIVDDVKELAAAKAKLNPLETLLIADEYRNIFEEKERY